MVAGWTGAPDGAPLLSDADHRSDANRHADDGAPGAPGDLLFPGGRFRNDLVGAHLLVESAVSDLLAFDLVGDQLHQVAAGRALRVGRRGNAELHRALDGYVLEVLL